MQPEKRKILKITSIISVNTKSKSHNMLMTDVSQGAVLLPTRNYLQLAAGAAFARYGEYLIASFAQNLEGIMIVLIASNFIPSPQFISMKTARMLRLPHLTEKFAFGVWILITSFKRVLFSVATKTELIMLISILLASTLQVRQMIKHGDYGTLSTKNVSWYKKVMRVKSIHYLSKKMALWLQLEIFMV